MNEVAKITDQVANKSDRWMLVAMFIIFMLAVLYAVRWLVADRERMATRLTTITDQHITATQEMSKVVANNTSALERFEETLRRN